jgi:probable F420-dependent oxidoreductase
VEVGVTVMLTDRSASVVEVAEAVEARGFASLWLPEHTHLPVRQSVPPAAVGGVEAADYARIVDPLVSLAAAAAVTRRILLGTGVVLAGQHDPLVLAKQVATLDQACGGRLVLGVGAGWNRAEAEDHGVAGDRRWERLADVVACLRALWGQEVAEHHGPTIDLPPCRSWPKPVRGAELPVLIGGAASPTVLEAVARWGDGWLPIGARGVVGSLEELRRRAAAAGRDPTTLQVVPFGSWPSAGTIEHLAAAGIGHVVIRVRSGPIGQVEAALDEAAGLLAVAAQGRP